MDTTSPTRRRQTVARDGFQLNGLLLVSVIASAACWAAIAYLIALIA